MNVAIGIGTLLLGGWVLSSPPDTTPQKPFADYQAYSGVSPYMNLFRADTANGTLDPYNMYVRPALQQQNLNQQFRNDIQAEEAMPYGEGTAPRLPPPGTTTPGRPTMMPTTPGLQQPGMQPPGMQQSSRANIMPLAPTEPAPPGTLGTPSLLPPTQPMMGEGAGSGMMSPMPGSGMWGSTMPMAPTYRRPMASSNSPASPFNPFEQQQTQYAAAAPQKAFAGYQSASSGVSPYMNLFRTDTSNGTIDNYTTLVRPALQQQYANQQFGNDIFGLQRSARLQSAALQRLDRSSRYLQGVGTPQFYQNNGGGYYPGYGP